MKWLGLSQGEAQNFPLKHHTGKSLLLLFHPKTRDSSSHVSLGCESGQCHRCWRCLLGLLSPGGEDSTAGSPSSLWEGLMCWVNYFRFELFNFFNLFLFFPPWKVCLLLVQGEVTDFCCVNKFYKELLNKERAISHMWMTIVKLLNVRDWEHRVHEDLRGFLVNLVSGALCSAIPGPCFLFLQKWEVLVASSRNESVVCVCMSLRQVTHMPLPH